MAMQRIYATTPREILECGHQGENLARCVCFDLTGLIEQYGQGTWSVVFRRPFESVPYPVANMETVGDYAVWGMDATDTSIAGEGRVELRYYVDDVLCKTDVYAVLIQPALGVTGEAPEPWEDIVDAMAQYASDASGSASSASRSATAAAASAAEAKEYADNIGDPVSGIVTNWLNEHVYPETGYVIDDTLTIRGAAADAKAVGDLKGQLTDLGLSEVDGVINITYEEVEN